MKLNDLSYPIELGKITSAPFFVDTETPIYVCGDGSLLSARGSTAVINEGALRNPSLVCAVRGVGGVHTS